jgi:outer membrane protein assembly factor BamA
MLAVVAFALALQAETITEVRVHGNATMTDAAIIQLAGVTVGATLDAGGIDAVERRLRESGRFDEVQVRKRYRTLAMDQASIVIVVHERPGVTATGEPPGMARRIRNHLMFFPIFHYDDGYGWTYGGRTSVVDVAGKGTRLSVPLSWGATRRAALEADRTFTSGPFTRVSGSVGIAQRENPHYSIDDRRETVDGRVERRLFRSLVLGAGASRTRVRFAPLEESFWSPAADVTLDTRRDPRFPSDAILAAVAWSRLNPAAGASFVSAIDRYGLDLRGYKRLFRQTVLAVRAEYDTASSALPVYEQWLLGGSNLRGSDAGAYAGDKRLIWSAEVRVPFSSPLHTGRTGFNVFVDGGATARIGERVTDRPQRRGVGAGLWLTAAVISLNANIAHSLDGSGTRFQFGTGFTF